MQYKIKQHRHSGRNYIDVVKGSRVKYKDHFSPNDLMGNMRDWFADEGYCSRSDPDFPEIFYNHKFFQGGLEEVRWWWRLSKTPPETQSGFYLYEIDVDVRIIAMKKTEIMKRGMKFKTNIGDIEINLIGRLVLDSNNRWHNDSLLKHFYEIYVNRIADTDINRHYTIVRRDVRKLKNSLHRYFKLPDVAGMDEGEGDFTFTADFD